MAGVTPTGFERLRLADIKTEIEDVLKTTFGSDINLSPESVFGQIVGIFSEREDLVWQAMEDVYNSQYPDTAFGASLDNVCALTGITRLAAKNAIAVITITGTPGTVIPSGSLAGVQNNGAQFLIASQITIPLSGTIDVTVSSVDTGLIIAPSGTLNQIVTPINGWTSVTNALDATPGSEIETDAALRTRRLEQLQKIGAGTIESIRSRLLSVIGVTHCIIFENDQDVTDVNGLPPHSFETFIEGGTDQDIANEIWLAKDAGIATFGDKTNTVIDSQGLPRTIKWSRPVTKNIYSVINVLSTNSLFPVDGATQIRDAILAYGNALQIGDPVIVIPAMIAAIAGIPGILNIEIFVGTAPAPTSSANIVQAINEIAVFDTSRITVNV